jgi:hypothetical protein
MSRMCLGWLLLVLIVCSCAAPTGILEPSVPAIQPAELPALPPPNTAVKRVSDTAYYELQPADIYASQGVDHWEMGFEFSGDTLSYAIFGIDPAERIPTRLDVDAYAEDLWIAVADYDHHRWRFLRGDGLHSCGTVDLSDGVTLPPGSLSGDGKYYLLLINPASYSAGEAVLRLYMKDSVGDSDPPQWPGAPGVTSVDFDEYGATINWEAATDPSGIAYYAVYVVPATYGVDYASPFVFELGASTSTYLQFPDEGYAYAVDVIAIDNMGNATPANTPYEFTIPDTPAPDTVLADIYPGDKVLVTWDDPEVDCGLYVVAPNFDEGDPQFGSEFNRRSFISGPDSLDSGLAEEWVQIRTMPPTGVYELDLSAIDLGVSGQTVQVSIVKPDGSTRKNLGSYDFTGPGGMMTLYGRLLMHQY